MPQVDTDAETRSTMQSFIIIIHFHSQTGGMKLKYIIQFLQQLNSAQRQLYTEVLKLAKFILVIIGVEFYLTRHIQIPVS